MKTAERSFSLLADDKSYHDDRDATQTWTSLKGQHIPSKDSRTADIGWRRYLVVTDSLQTEELSRSEPLREQAGLLLRSPLASFGWSCSVALFMPTVVGLGKKKVRRCKIRVNFLGSNPLPLRLTHSLVEFSNATHTNTVPQSHLSLPKKK